MESFEGHLSCWLANTLSSQSTNSFSRFNNGSVHPFDVYLEEKQHLFVSDTVETVSQVFLILLVFALHPLVILGQVLRFFSEICPQISKYFILEMFVQTNNQLIFYNLRYLLLRLLYDLFGRQITLSSKISSDQILHILL